MQFNFDASQVEPSGGSSANTLPAGEYSVIITDTEMKETSSKNGMYLEIEMQVTDGPQAGQTQVDRLNLQNSSQQAVEIAYKQLSAYCHVTGQLRLNDTRQLHNIPFRIKVAPGKPMKEGATTYSEVKAVRDINGNAPGKQGQGQSLPQPAPAPAQPPAMLPQQTWQATSSFPTQPVAPAFPGPSNPQLPPPHPNFQQPGAPIAANSFPSAPTPTTFPSNLPPMAAPWAKK